MQVILTLIPDFAQFQRQLGRSMFAHSFLHNSVHDPVLWSTVSRTMQGCSRWQHQD